jgi:uncharacterized protein (TIGR00730 family)
MQDRRVFLRDGFTDAEVDLIADEFRRGFAAVAAIDRPAATIFGSARVGEDDPGYVLARATGRAFADRGWAVVTGGGPGIMEAANRGAQEGGGLSVGFTIRLKTEEASNGFLDRELAFKHFYARKTMFVKAAEGFVVFESGIGTLDELFEALVLIQTGKIVHFPVVLAGRAHWAPLLDWIHRSLIPRGLISQSDLDLVTLTDDPAEAAETVIACHELRCAHRVPGT